MSTTKIFNNISINYYNGTSKLSNNDNEDAIPEPFQLKLNLDDGKLVDILFVSIADGHGGNYTILGKKCIASDWLENNTERVVRRYFSENKFSSINMLLSHETLYGIREYLQIELLEYTFNKKDISGACFSFALIIQHDKERYYMGATIGDTNIVIINKKTGDKFNASPMLFEEMKDEFIELTGFEPVLSGDITIKQDREVGELTFVHWTGEKNFRHPISKCAPMLSMGRECEHFLYTGTKMRKNIDIGFSIMIFKMKSDCDYLLIGATDGLWDHHTIPSDNVLKQIKLNINSVEPEDKPVNGFINFHDPKSCKKANQNQVDL